VSEDLTEELINFVRLQLDEDERIARKATSGDPWRMEGMSIRGGTRMNHTDVLVVRHTWPQEAEHIARHDPARVLREVDSLRKIVDDLAAVIADDEGMGYYSDGHSGLATAKRTLRLLAAIFDDRPGYREEWRPQ
jgi:hypothetical protein